MNKTLVAVIFVVDLLGVALSMPFIPDINTLGLYSFVLVVIAFAIVEVARK